MALGTLELHAVLPGVRLAQCCSTGQTICAVENRAQGNLCHFLVPSCRCPPTREVTELKKKKIHFFQHRVVVLHLSLQRPQLLASFPPLCSWHPVTPAWVILTTDTLSLSRCAVCLPGALLLPGVLPCQCDGSAKRVMGPQCPEQLHNI